MQNLFISTPRIGNNLTWCRACKVIGQKFIRFFYWYMAIRINLNLNLLFFFFALKLGYCHWLNLNHTRTRRTLLQRKSYQWLNYRGTSMHNTKVKGPCAFCATATVCHWIYWGLQLHAKNSLMYVPFICHHNYIFFVMDQKIISSSDYVLNK